MTAALTVFQNHDPPPPIVDRIGEIAPRPVFLVYAVPGSGQEDVRQPKYFAAAGEPKEVWKVPGQGTRAASGPAGRVRAAGDGLLRRRPARHALTFDQP